MSSNLFLLGLFGSCTKEQVLTEDSKYLDTSLQEIDLAPYNDFGFFLVGHKQIEHTYTPFEGSSERTIVIDIWYPTTDVEGEIGTYVYGIDEEVFENATIADSIHLEGYPIHLHSHGYQGWGATSAFLMRYFASHGWIAIAPNHTNNLLADHIDPLPTAHFIHRPLDLKYSLDMVIEDALFSERDLQINNVLMSGHSFGASYSTWGIIGASYDQIEQSCETGNGLEEGSCSDQELSIFTSGMLSDDRIKAALPLAGTIRKTFFGETGYKNVQVPVLFMSGTEDNPQSAIEHYDEINGINFSWLSLEGGCHQSFALGQCSTLDVPTGFDIIQTYALAFARKYILQVEDEEIENLLQGYQQPWIEATVQQK